MTHLTEQLPLFPLGIVLLPGMPLPLHIFEPRYKRLIGECLENETSFGVVYDPGSGHAGVGCSATILDLLGRYPDGRMDILVSGERRFRILSTNDERAYLCGEIEWLEEKESGPLDGPRETLLEAYRRTFWAHFQAIPPSQLATADPLSFAIARAVLLAADDRQRVLETETEQLRLELLTELLATVEQNMKAVSGNGRMKREIP